MLKMSFTVSFLWEKILDAVLIWGQCLLVFLFSDAVLIEGGLIGVALNQVNTVFNFLSHKGS